MDLSVRLSANAGSDGGGAKTLQQQQQLIQLLISAQQQQQQRVVVIVVRDEVWGRRRFQPVEVVHRPTPTRTSSSSIPMTLQDEPMPAVAAETPPPTASSSSSSKRSHKRRKRESSSPPARSLKYVVEEKLEIIDYAKVAGNRAAGREFSVAESSIREWRKNEPRLRALLTNDGAKVATSALATTSRIDGRPTKLKSGSGKKSPPKSRDDATATQQQQQLHSSTSSSSSSGDASPTPVFVDSARNNAATTSSQQQSIDCTLASFASLVTAAAAASSSSPTSSPSNPGSMLHAATPTAEKISAALKQAAFEAAKAYQGMLPPSFALVTPPRLSTNVSSSSLSPPNSRMPLHHHPLISLLSTPTAVGTVPTLAGYASSTTTSATTAITPNGAGSGGASRRKSTCPRKIIVVEE